MINNELWKKCSAFHGHECPGLTIGYRAALYAIKLLDLKLTKDEEIVCVCENNACGVDAIQVILGCSAGKGNLLFHIVGKQAFTVYECNSGKSVRIVLKNLPDGLSRAETFDYLHEKNDEEIFDVKPAKIEIPERPGMVKSFACAECGEMTNENHMRLSDGKMLCPDCAGNLYDRYHI